ncbi:Hemolysin-type calcium-binding region, partial [Pseudomonas savastanoi pv. glycinea]
MTATSLTDSTTAAISTLLALDSASTVNLASWEGVNRLEVPTGQTGTTDVITGTIAGARGDLVTLNVTAEVAAAKAIILDSQANLSVNITPTLATDAAADVSSLARVAVSADASATTQFLLTTGSGDDVIIVNGDQNNYIDAGAGNDTIITGNGNNTVIAGAGNNNNNN